ncbi:2'-deoxycytidine 5'-triphosphate deaminase [Rhodovibrionaceae bacterium A322]
MSESTATQDQALDNGILPSQAVRRLIADGAIRSSDPDLESLVQPSSIDLRLGRTAYRVRASFLPGKGKTVHDRIDALSMHKIDLSEGAVLEVGCVYIVPLMESLHLSDQISGMANPKSSTGRLNLFTRLIVDGAEEFDRVPAGYDGPLYAEIAPNAFSILVRPGVRLNQVRFRQGTPTVTDQDLQQLHDETGLVGSARDTAQINKGLLFTVDLNGIGPDKLAGYKAKRHAAVIDVSKIGHYDPREYWDAIPADPDGRLILDPNEFYILASRERVRIPPDYAAEMMPYDTSMGEFRVHYAGFFDPGFGWSPDTDGSQDGGGTRAVLEVRSHEVPFLLEHGQAVGRMVYDRLLERPDEIYGADIGSNYHAQALTLSKHFKAWD